MRLIDADELNKGFNDSPMGLAMKKLIDNQPTAYDIDKVVEELEESSEKFTEYDVEIDDYVSLFAIGIHKALKIVKQGGR